MEYSASIQEYYLFKRLLGCGRSATTERETRALHRKLQTFDDRHDAAAAAAAEDPRGINLYTAAIAVGAFRAPSAIRVYPITQLYGSRPCVGPPGVESPSYVGGDRRRQEVCIILYIG